MISRIFEFFDYGSDRRVQWKGSDRVEVCYLMIDRNRHFVFGVVCQYRSDAS